MKRILALVISVLFASNLFASVIGGDIGSVKVASTEHFDIIYKAQGSETAAVIFENCEDIYNSLVAFFNADPNMHIPVVVTSVYKELNAYYSAYPANRIVMFDTVVTPGDLSNFRSSILGVFRHELTHAFHYNIRGPFFQGLSEVFGDIVSLSPLLYLYPSLTEGGAVLSESVDGYGRINSSYSMQIVRQAKMEGLFPNWFEVAGARDTYPSGLLYYNFSAAFLDYLAQTYGLEKVTSIYEGFSHLRWWSTPGQVIKSRIGKSVREAWKDFYEWVDIPEDIKEGQPVESRSRSASYCTPYLATDGSIYIYDYSSWDVLRFKDDLSTCESVLTVPTSRTSLSVSSDGRHLLVPFVSQGSASVRLYDISGKRAVLEKIFSSHERDLRDGTFVNFDGSEYVLLYGNSGKSTYLDLYDISSMEKVEPKSLALGFDRTAFGFNSLDDGRVAFVTTLEARDNIAVLDLDDMSLKLVENPDGIRILSLSKSNGGDLCFSWYPSSSSETSTGRYGEISISGEGISMRLSDSDVSGSVNSPLRLGDEVLFMARFFEHQGLRRIAVSELGLSEPRRLGLSDAATPDGPSTDNLIRASRKYRPINYLGDGVLIPFASAEFGIVTMVAFGLNWRSTDPTETFTHNISAGYGFGNMLASYTFTPNTLIPYSVFASVSYGTGMSNGESSLPSGYTLLSAGASSSLTLEFENPYNKLSVSDKYVYTMAIAPSGAFADSHGNHLEVAFQSARKTGMGIYQRFAFTAKAYSDLLLPGVAVGFSLPSLLWWRCDGPNMTNLPFTFKADAHFTNGYDNISLTAQASVVLYGREIQRAIQLLGLHVQRFTLDATYIANYQTESRILTHQAQLGARFTFSPIVGAYLTRLKTELGAALVWSSAADDLMVKVYFSLGT